MAKKKTTTKKTKETVNVDDIASIEIVDVNDIPNDAEVLDCVEIIETEDSKQTVDELLADIKDEIIVEEIVETQEVTVDVKVEEQEVKTTPTMPRKITIRDTFWGYSWNGQEFEF